MDWYYFNLGNLRESLHFVEYRHEWGICELWN